MPTVTGTANDDRLFAEEGAETDVFGLSGNDTLFANNGGATFDGGPGVDWIYYTTTLNGVPVFSNGATVDLSTGQATASVGGATQAYSIINVENIRGSNASDILTGDVLGNEIQGFAGDDVINGLGGEDVIFSGSGDDTVNGGDGDDSLFAMSGNATLDGNAGGDFVRFNTTSGGADIFTGGVTANLAIGLATAAIDQQDYRYILSNIENLWGSNFADQLTGDSSDNEIQGLGGNDAIFGMGGDDVLFSGDGEDTVSGGAGNDSLYGMSGNATLDGNEGDDWAFFDTFLDGQAVFTDGVTVNLSIEQAAAQIGTEVFSYSVLNIESLFGSRYDDILIGDEGDNTIRGYSGDDIIKGGAGNDFLSGGDGNDVGLYDGASGHFTVQYHFADSMSFIIDRTGQEGTDSNGTNILRFSDRDVTVVADGNDYYENANLSQSDFRSIVELYIAYFDRAPDAEGLNFWTISFINGTSLDQAAAFFFNQPETRALYGTEIDTQLFVDSVYQNVLGRGPDNAGLAFWVGALSDRSVTEGQFIRSFLEGARAEPAGDASVELIAQQNLDRAYLDAKTDIGMKFAAILGMSNIENANAVMNLFDGSTESVLAAQAATNEAYQAALATDGTGEFLIQLVGLVDDPFA